MRLPAVPPIHYHPEENSIPSAVLQESVLAGQNGELEGQISLQHRRTAEVLL